MKNLAEGVRQFRQSVEAGRLQGAVLYAERDGTTLLHEAIGWRNREAGLPMLVDTLFRMASNTKAGIATAVLMLAEAGRLRLDDPIGRHFPPLDNRRFELVTIRQLLSHTSGLRIPDFVDQDWSAEGNVPTLEQAVTPFAEIGPAVAPGTSYQYSNPGYNILGAMIERVAGCPLDRFLDERIYRPLGMRDTFHRPEADRAGRMSVVYERRGTSWEVLYRQDSPMKVPFVRASGGMISTASDFATFCRMFLNHGVVADRPLLSAESIAMATSPQTASLYTPEQIRRRKKFYGFGWMVAPDGVYSHAGSLGTEAWVDPASRLIVLVLTQSVAADIPGQEFFEMLRAEVG